MLDITTSKDYKPSLNQTLWMQSKASVYNSIILMINNNFKQFCKFYFDKNYRQSCLFFLKQQNLRQYYTVFHQVCMIGKGHIAFPFSSFFSSEKKKAFLQVKTHQDAILETTEQCRSITQHIMYKVFWLTKNGFLFCNVTLTFRKYLRETLKISNSEDLNRLTACSLVLLGNAFLCQGITQVCDFIQSY